MNNRILDLEISITWSRRQTPLSRALGNSRSLCIPRGQIIEIKETYSVAEYEMLIVAIILMIVTVVPPHILSRAFFLIYFSVVLVCEVKNSWGKDCYPDL